MSLVEVTRTLSGDEVDAWLAPRHDVVREAAPAFSDGEDGTRTAIFALADGPFRHYERRVEIAPHPDAGQSDAGIPDAAAPVVLTQTTSFRLGLGPWSALFLQPIKGALRRPGGDAPWWAPPDVLDAAAARSLASLAYLSLVAGYLGTLITQTITYAAEEFDAGETAQGDTLAAVRIGVLLSLGIAAWADRNGRRRAILFSAAGGCIVAALGALSPGLWFLGGTQVVARGLSTTLALLLMVVIAEEMPAGARAYGASLITMSTALGAGMVLWVLPIVDVDEGLWRVIYALPLAFLPLIRASGRMLGESRRFVRRHATSVSFAGHGWRLFLLAGTALLLAIFTTPASQLQNEYLRDEFSFSATRISLFTMLTVSPGGIGIIIGGRLADRRGKRLIGGIGLTAGALLTSIQFLVDTESLLWLSSFIGSMVGGLAVPALAVYGPELFPTALRTKANVVITILGVTGSAIGLVLAGRLADIWSLGPGIAVLAVAPVLATVALLPFYPETARRELEDLNPEDRDPDAGAGSAAISPLGL